MTPNLLSPTDNKERINILGNSMVHIYKYTYSNLIENILYLLYTIYVTLELAYFT